MGVCALGQATPAGIVLMNPLWEARSTSGNKPKMLTLVWTAGAGSMGAVGMGIGRPAAIGVTPTSPQAFVDEDDGNAPSPYTTGATAWGVAPTQPPFFNRRVTLNCTNQQGVGYCANFPAGFGLSGGGSVVLWLISLSVSPSIQGDVFSTVEE